MERPLEPPREFPEAADELLERPEEAEEDRPVLRRDGAGAGLA
ncbi:MAG: hypothetical protein R3236_10815 [Phycisphaeraceae bacterium]|nr:hypothetical protein [Phycisphaeraceae bacterium]